MVILSCKLQRVEKLRLRSQHSKFYTAADQCTHLRPSQSLDSGDVLPGVKLPLKELFASTRRR